MESNKREGEREKNREKLKLFALCSLVCLQSCVKEGYKQNLHFRVLSFGELSSRNISCFSEKNKTNCVFKKKIEIKVCSSVVLLQTPKKLEKIVALVFLHLQIVSNLKLCESCKT